MNESLLQKRKRLLATFFVYSLSIKAKKLQLLQLRKQRMQRQAKVLLLMKGFLSAESGRKIWMKKRHGRFWELDVRQNGNDFFEKTFSMSRKSFDLLCSKVKGIGKKDTNFRLCIPLEKRVAIALYSLRSSSEYRTIGNLFGVSATMVCKILKDFCDEVWKMLAQEYLPSDFLAEKKVAECVKGFANLGFPQCLGAMDGCHIEMKPYALDQTDYHNYKGWKSTILFALVDYRYRFLYINVGAPGRCHDSQIFEKSLLKKKLLESAVLKQKAKVINGVCVPVMVLGDSAFRFSELVMKPFPFSVSASEMEKTFNYHLSKARRVVENAFGQLKVRFRRIGKGIENNAKNVNAIIKCCCVLHNFLKEQNEHINQTWSQQYEENEASLTQPEVENTFADHEPKAEEIRNAISSFLCSSELSVPGSGESVLCDNIEEEEEEDSLETASQATEIID